MALFGVSTAVAGQYFAGILSTNTNSNLLPGFRLWFIRSEDLLDLEFRFINLSRLSNDKTRVQRIKKNQSAYMMVTLPVLHVAEELYADIENVSKDTIAQSYAAFPSTLVFRFFDHNLKNFRLNAENILSWNFGKFFELIILNNITNKKTETSISLNDILINYDSKDSNCGIPYVTSGISTTAVPITSFEAIFGVSFSPALSSDMDQTCQAGFLSNNKLHSLKRYNFPDPGDSLEKEVYTNYQDSLLSLSNTNAGRNITDRTALKLFTQNYQEIWSNPMIYRTSAGVIIKPALKVVAVNEQIADNSKILPTKDDKRNLSKQFREEDNITNGGKKKKPSVISQQIVEVVSDHFRLTSLGLMATLNYISPDEEALLQKWRQGIVLGRDEYIEVQRLGYTYPTPVRAVEVVIGRRVINNGNSYIERRKYMFPLEKVVVFRTVEEQQADSPLQSVLQRIVEHSYKEEANYLRSCKRSSLFQRLEILTSELVEIQDFEEEVNVYIEDKLIEIYNNKDVSVAEYIRKAQELLSFLNANYKQVRAHKIIGVLIPNELYEMAAEYAGSNYNQKEFVNLVTSFLQLKPQIKTLSANSINGFEGLAPLVTNLFHAMEGVSDKSINNLEQGIQSACDDALAHFNDKSAAIDSRRNIVSITAQGSARVCAFWPVQKNGQDVKFQYLGTDWDGQTVEFEAPFIFVSGDSVRRIDDLYTRMSVIKAALLPEIDPKVLYLQEHTLQFKSAVDSYLDRSGEVLASINPNEDVQVKALRTALMVQLYSQSEQLAEATESGLALTSRSVLSKVTLPEQVAAILDFSGKTINEFEQIRRTAQQRISALTATEQSYAPTLRRLLDTAELLYTLNAIFSQEIGQLTGPAEFASRATQLKALGADMVSRIGAWGPNVDKNVQQEWHQIQNWLHKLDDELVGNYHSFNHAKRRAISVAGAKIAFYKSLAEETNQGVRTGAENAINNLQTSVLEFAAVPLVRMAEFREIARTVQGDGDQEYQRIRQFTKQFPLTYLQFLAAKVKPPVVRELMDGGDNSAILAAEAFDMTKGVVIGYADAFRLAGIEGWRGMITDAMEKEEQGRRNAEQILFQVQKPFQQATNTIAKQAGDAAAAVNRLRQEIANTSEVYTGLLYASKRQLNGSVRDFEATTAGYVKGTITNIFSHAHDRVGGLINPGIVISKISVIPNLAYTLNNEVNAITGEINRYSTAAQSFVKEGKGDVKKFAREAHKHAIDDFERVRKMLDEIKIFGLPIADLLNKKLSFSPADLPEAQVKIVKDTSFRPVSSEVAYRWSPSKDKRMFQNGEGLVKFVNGTGLGDTTNADIALSLSSKMDFNTGASDLDSEVSLANFGISAAEIIQVNFEKISFRKRIVSSGGTIPEGNTTTKSDVQVKIRGVVFSGMLDLVKQLQDSLGISDNFLTQINTKGVTVSYGVRVPAISTGAFTLSNVSLYAGLVLSYQNASPSVRFAFGERLNPFTLAVGIFGGRGFFAVNVNGEGIELLEGSLEFGAFVALNIAGIARGQAYLMGGIYFRKSTHEHVYVEAYIVCGGSLSIIGLVQVSVVFYMGMSYQNNALRGRASVEVSVKVLFFSASYTLSLEKRINGSDGVAITEFLDAHTASYAHHEAIKGPNASIYDVQDYDATEPFLPASNSPYCYLLNEQAPTSSSNRYVPVYDPTVLYEHQMDFAEYARQFGN